MNKKNALIGLLLGLAIVGFLKRDFVTEKIKPLVHSPYKSEVLAVVLSTGVPDLAPEHLDLDTLTRTENIYEGLVAFDRTLKIVPALALSWGNLSPTVWEFKLRKEVRFHDGTPLEGAGVVAVLEKLKTFQAVRLTDPFTLQIETAAPDPLLLAKLTKLFITRPGNVGTGPYKVREWIPGGLLSLTAFTDYWGRHPVYRNAEYQVLPDRTERRRAFEDGKIDILSAVPRDQALELPQEQLKKSYGLEVNMLMFKLDDPRLADRKTREAIQTLIDPAKIEAIGNYFVRPAAELVAPGVFGYNPTIQPFVFDEKNMAQDLFGKRVEKISLDFLETYRTLSEYLTKQLRTAGFSVQPNPLPAEQLLTQIRKNLSPLFIIGWQADDGDAGGFLDAFLDSRGEFNGGRYKNPDVDRWIAESRQEMNPEKRLVLLQLVLAQAQKDLVAIPLFESSRITAVKPGILWEPRTDGLVLAAEVK